MKKQDVIEFFDRCAPWWDDDMIRNEELIAAILNNGGSSLEGCKIYVALFPCNECAKAIIQCGIKEVYYLSDKYADTPGTRASKRMFDSAGVKYTALTLEHDEIKLDFRAENV